MKQLQLFKKGRLGIKFLSILLALAMTLVMLPVTAFAAESGFTAVLIGSQNITTEATWSSTRNGGTITWNAATATLTLNNADLSNWSNYAGKTYGVLIDAKDKTSIVTIKLIGTNTIGTVKQPCAGGSALTMLVNTVIEADEGAKLNIYGTPIGGASYDVGNAIYIVGNLSVGGGTINLVSGYPAMYVQKTLTIESSSISAGSNRVGIFANGDITITDSTVKASGGTDESSGDRCTAIYTPNTLTIDGASKVTANGDYRGIQGNTVTIGGNAEVNVTGQDEALVSFDVGISGDSVVKATSVNSSAITGKTSLSITQNADVVATGAVCAILAEDTLVLSAKNIEAYSTSHYAIFNIGVGKNITIGGKLEAQSTNVYAIRSYGNIITDNQADIKAAGGWGGIHADGNITFNGSKIEAIGNDDDGIYSTGTISINGGSVHAKGANGYAAIRAKNIRTAEEAAVSKITVTNLVEKNGGKVAFCDWFSHASGGTGSWTTFIGKDETALVTNSGGGITNGLTEVWLAAPYIVTFDVNGGSGENSTVQVYPGNKVTAPTTEPAKDGRHFSGWYLDETEFDFVNTTITKAITLKAKFDVHAPNADDGDCTTPITCPVCGEITTPAKTAHTWGAGEVTTPATHTADGMKTLTCTVCVQVKTEVIPATGHTWSTEWSKDASNHWHKCAANDGGIKDTGAHSPGEGATIEHPQLCTICGYEITPKLPSKDAAEDNATGIKVEYENGSPFDSRITLRVISKPQAEMDQFQEAVDKAAPGLVLGGLYDISFFKDGVEIQPDDQIKVSIPLVEPMKTMTDLQIVYIDDNGKTAIIPSTVADDKITFITDHFSNYGIIGKVEADNSDASDGAPSTGENSPILPIVLVAFASGTALIILGQKRKFKLIKK